MTSPDGVAGAATTSSATRAGSSSPVRVSAGVAEVQAESASAATAAPPHARAPMPAIVPRGTTREVATTQALRAAASPEDSKRETARAAWRPAREAPTVLAEGP